MNPYQSPREEDPIRAELVPSRRHRGLALIFLCCWSVMGIPAFIGLLMNSNHAWETAWNNPLAAIGVVFIMAVVPITCCRELLAND